MKIEPNWLKIGCPMWQHSGWQNRIYSSNNSTPALYHYSRLFNSVEGNTSFYHMPDQQTLCQWAKQTPEDFRFTFKFPRAISHEGQLTDHRSSVKDCLTSFAQLEQKLGCLMLQLPASFGPSRLDELRTFLQWLPTEFSYAVEVRHREYYAKGEVEKRFNQLLFQYNINRVILDTRGLFGADPGSDDLIKEVQSKKPRVPCNVIATGNSPIVRLVGHPSLPVNQTFFTPWISKLLEWKKLGLQPYFFFHMADNALAPWLAQQCIEQLTKADPSVTLLPVKFEPFEKQQLGFL